MPQANGLDNPSATGLATATTAGEIVFLFNRKSKHAQLTAISLIRDDMAQVKGHGQSSGSMICQWKQPGRALRVVSAATRTEVDTDNKQQAVALMCPTGMTILNGSISGTCCSRKCDQYATVCTCRSCSVQSSHAKWNGQIICQWKERNEAVQTMSFEKQIMSCLPGMLGTPTSKTSTSCARGFQEPWSPKAGVAPGATGVVSGPCQMESLRINDLVGFVHQPNCLALAEVEIFDTQGQRITPTSATMSSTIDTSNDADKCIDTVSSTVSADKQVRAL